jgi:hypothetical protein
MYGQMLQVAFCISVCTRFPHWCVFFPRYTVTLRVVVKEPVQVRTYTWCLKVPPRCTKYKVEMRDRVKIQVSGFKLLAEIGSNSCQRQSQNFARTTLNFCQS